MATKKKKQLLKDDEIRETITLVQKRFPQYPISPAMIRNPSKDFVLGFYSRCVEEIENAVAEVTRTRRLHLPSTFSEEEAIFYRLSKIPMLMQEVDFKLGDLYQFDPKRLNTHMFIVAHFMVYLQSIKDETTQICDRVFDAKEKYKQIEEDVQMLKEKKIQKQLVLTNLKQISLDLKDEAAQLLPHYEKAMELIEKSEEKCKDKLLEIEHAKNELKNFEEEIEKLERTKQELQGLVITETEYHTLKNKLESLKVEESNLEDIDINNILLEQKQKIEYLQTCLAKLDQLELPPELYKLHECRAELKDIDQKLEHVINLKKEKKAEIEALQAQLESEKLDLEKVKKDLKNSQKRADLGRQKKEELNKAKEYEKNNNELKKQEKKRVLEKIEADYDTIKVDVEEKYGQYCQIQDGAMNKLKSIIQKTNPQLPK